jgi:hypothetical protein
MNLEGQQVRRALQSEREIVFLDLRTCRIIEVLQPPGIDFLEHGRIAFQDVLNSLCPRAGFISGYSCYQGNPTA